MTFNFKQALTPLIKGSADIDQRYSSSVNRAIQLAGEETINSLLTCYQESTDLTAKYGADAYKLARSLFQSAEEWQLSACKKQLTPMLLELGFKKAHTSKIIGAAEFADQQRRNKSEALPWIESLPISSQYRLSIVSDRAFGVLWTETSEFGTKDVTRAVIEEVGNKHPHTPKELGAKKHYVNDSSSKPSPFTSAPVIQATGPEPGGSMTTTDDVVTHNTIDITAASQVMEAELDKPSAILSLSAVEFVDVVNDYIKTNKDKWSDRDVVSVSIAGELLLKAVGKRT